MLSGIAFFVGHLVGLLAVAAPRPVWCWLALAAAALCVWRCRSGRWARWVQGLAAAVAGFALLSLAVEDWLSLRLPASADGERLLIVGEILTVPDLEGDEASFDARVRTLLPRSRSDEPVRTFRVRWRGAPPGLVAHETWQWLIRLDTQIPSRRAIDLERIWLRDQIHARAIVMPAVLNARQRLAAPSIDALRERIARGIERAVVDRDAAALIRALAVGLTDRMTREQWRVFAATGTTHLVAISGLHVTLFALVACAIARRIWRLAPGAPLLADREPFALGAGLLAAWGYALLAGWSVPTQRTLIMLAVFAAIQWQQRALSGAHILTAALVAVLLLDPVSPLAAGLWLSFGAVAAILWIELPRVRRVPNWWAAGRVQLAIVLALAPATVAMFGSLSVSSLLVNVVAIPVISFVLVPLVLLGSLGMLVWPGAGGALLRLAESLYAYGWPPLAAAAEWPLSRLTIEPPVVWYPLVGVALVCALSPLSLRLRLSTVAALLPLLSVGETKLAAGEFDTTIYDTGRGVAVVLQTATRTVLYDTGDYFDSRGRPLQNLLNAGLLVPRESRLDLVVLPRVTQDRAAGLGRLVTRVEVGQLRGGGSWHGSLLPYRPCVDGESRHFDGVRIELLVGASGEHEYCALRVSTPSGSMLLAGDYDQAAERDAVRRASDGGRALNSDLLLMSRRGSAAGSSAEWLVNTRPSVAVVTGAVATRSTSPRAAVLRRWRAQGARVIETDSSPVVKVRRRSHSLNIELVGSNDYPFLWRSRPEP